MGTYTITSPATEHIRQSLFPFCFPSASAMPPFCLPSASAMPRIEAYVTICILQR